MGRRPKPTHLKLIQGNAGKRRLNSAEPQPEPCEAPAPEHLTRYAREAWDRLAPMLRRMGLLTVADTIALERLCACYAEAREMSAILEMEGGGTYETKNVSGETMFRPRPEAARLADADRRLKGYLGEFGLTPAARSKVRTAAGGGKPDPLDAYFS
jgi:P27 family predicted phage terminase small subunit